MPGSAAPAGAAIGTPYAPRPWHRATRAAACAGILLLAGGCGDDGTPPHVPRCIPSGDQTDINTALAAPGSDAILCAGAVFELTGPVRFLHLDQQIFTEGFPSDDSRAVLRIAAPDVVTAVDMTNRSQTVLSHVIVDGARPRFGAVSGGAALIRAGGSAFGQIIQFVKAYEPRGWSILHLFEGGEPRCASALVLGNELGPAGLPDGSWADGISLACRDSFVIDNTIVDATDGGIVIFGAPGSLIEDNTIRAVTRPLLGGINMVDYLPYDGDYSGTRVSGNVIDAAGARVQVGLGMGYYVWVCFDPATAPAPQPTLRGATVTDNTLRGDHMRYGFAVDGVAGWTVTGNTDLATHSGTPSRACGDRLASPPAGFQINRARAAGTFQAEFVDAVLDMALWAVDSPPD